MQYYECVNGTTRLVLLNYWLPWIAWAVNTSFLKSQARSRTKVNIIELRTQRGRLPKTAQAVT